jgi:uncharacterized protein
MARRLPEFLAAPRRPEGAMSYCECAGFMFAVANSPEMIAPSEWIPMIFDSQDAGYESPDEAKEIMEIVLALSTYIAGTSFAGSPELPTGCEPRRKPLDNLVPDAPLSRWARGFATGHDCVSEIWDESAPAEMDEELDALLMAFSFFESRKLAEAYLEQCGNEKLSLEQLASDMLRLLPDAMSEYAQMGKAIAQALQEDYLSAHTPVRSEKIGRNQPCPCGSGKKYKKCCGRVH